MGLVPASLQRLGDTHALAICAMGVLSLARALRRSGASAPNRALTAPIFGVHKFLALRCARRLSTRVYVVWFFAKVPRNPEIGTVPTMGVGSRFLVHLGTVGIEIID